MLWGAYLNNVYLIDMGDPTVSGDALATFQFNPNVGGIGLIDGLAWDSSDDTLYHSPDIDCSVYQFSLGTGGNPPLGTLMNTVTPKNAGGVADCDVSGVAIGSANSLYIGRNGNNEIRRVDKTTGAFVSTFATTAGRVEDLVCDPVTYAPLEAVLAKDAFMSLYEAFEVEAGTCPLPVPMCNGRPATIYVDANNIIVGGLENGTPYLGRLRGTNGKDVMVGTDGPDRIWGYDDDDTICGGDGNDQIEGGAGNDWIDGEAGDDRLQGQAGDDTILGGDGNDHISGGNGNDTIGGGPGDDTILGEAGDDDIDGGTGHNTINGGTGVDICVNTGGTGVIKNCNP
jgi:Ca2+-binding RTX toxin-like protein